MMSEENKCCKVCGKIISTAENDYYSHIKILYCDKCRDAVKREQTRLRVAELHKRKKQKDKYRDEELELLRERVGLLETENNLLRKRITELRNEVKKL